MLDLPTLRERLLGRIDLPVDRGLVRADAIRTCFYQAGRGTPLVLLHGAAAGALYWYPVIGPLGRAFRVTAPDMVGYGESDKPLGRYDRPFYRDWLTRFLDAVGIERTHLMGLSQGAAVALGFAHAFPERVERLVLVSPRGSATASDWVTCSRTSPLTSTRPQGYIAGCRAMWSRTGATTMRISPAISSRCRRNRVAVAPAGVGAAGRWRASPPRSSR